MSISTEAGQQVAWTKDCNRDPIRSSRFSLFNIVDTHFPYRFDG